MVVLLFVCGNVLEKSIEEVINCNDLETKSKFKSSFLSKSESSSSLGASMSEASIALTVLVDSVAWDEASSLFKSSTNEIKKNKILFFVVWLNI